MIRFITPLAPRASEIANLNSKVADRLRGTGLFSVLDLENDANAHNWHHHLRQPTDDDETLDVVHIGNNHLHHSGCMRYAFGVPSVCVLHDRNLSGLIRGAHITSPSLYDLIARKVVLRNGPAGFQRFKRALVDPNVGDEVEAQSWDLFAENALALVTHNPTDLPIFRSQADVPVYHVDLPHFFEASQPYRTEFKRGDTLKLIMFGFMGSNRRLRPVVEIVRSFAKTYPIELHIYGQVNLDQADMRFIEEACVERSVVMHGFVTDAELEAALRSSHLAINLRFPTMGEASSSQLRIFEFALPSVVTDIGWYGKLPDDVVFKVSQRTEQQDLVTLLERAISDPQLFSAYGARGRSYLEKVHRFDLYFDKILRIKGDLTTLRRGWVDRRLVQRVSWRMAGLMDNEHVRKEVSARVTAATTE
ncbi:hypothetical protein ACGGKE_18525 (plasmid) [Sphingobium naphthae]|uniref:hypothetical protein n=1 Tax=Sphingobium naphthae TaxID=1886786 RepID=UPI0037487128